MGKLLGPKGNSMKRLQEHTMTKMAVLGKGSMRDKHKVRRSWSGISPDVRVCGLKWDMKNFLSFSIERKTKN